MDSEESLQGDYLATQTCSNDSLVALISISINGIFLEGVESMVKEKILQLNYTSRYLGTPLE